MILPKTTRPLSQKTLRWFVFVFVGLGMLLSSQAAHAANSAGDIGLNAFMIQARLGTLAAVFILGEGLSIAAQGVDWVLRLDVATNAPVIGLVWTIVRDFSNMFFIVFLIIAAFATIFDLGSFGYSGYDIGSLVGKLLVAALLINFSLVIGQEILSWTQVINGAFLTSIGSLADHILIGLKPQALLGNGKFFNCLDATSITLCEAANRGVQALNNVPILGRLVTAAQLAKEAAIDNPGDNLKKLFQSVMTIVLYGILLFSLLVPFVFGIVRVPFLWFLLIISPLAWLCMILPNTRHIHQYWWKQFWGWNLFLPIYLFFITIGMSVLARQNEIMTGLMSAWANNSTTLTGALGAAVMTPLSAFFFYIFVGMVLIGGAGMAFKSSFLAGTAAAGVATWSRGVVGRKTGVTATGQALQKRVSQIKEGGLPGRVGQFIYGGDIALEKQTQAIGRRLGVKATPKDISAKRSEMDKLTDAEVRTKISSSDRTEMLAAREILLSRGKLSAQEITDTQNIYQDISPVAAGSFRQRAQASIAAKVEGGKFEGTTYPDKATEAMAFVSASIAEEDPVKKDKEVTDTINKLAKKDVLIATHMSQQRAAATNAPFVFRDVLIDKMKGLTVDEIVGQKEDTLREVYRQLGNQRIGISQGVKQKILSSENLTSAKEALLRLIM